ncbi:hypothetical protein [Amycolatopsis taiwanensis]|uniref:Uncharacterized protein n=1 Tax=Amycolatopsis taiwanensis TaxID=342230 RepID=A0A9W6VFD2_9PSEU|nr:hypothetical protein [Amycolatopsis taiwanensis]GLY66680.1 hypothetical protein Atai01_32990 [Amycolatopsis taiwanensis]
MTSQAGGSTQLHSNDPATKVGAFYLDALAEQGWTTTSKYQGQHSTNVVAKRGREGVTVQVSPSGSGSSISVTTYPVP